MLPIKTILLPTDFSECSSQALRVATLLARETKARLIVLHVAEMEVVYSGVLGGVPTDPLLYLNGLESHLAHITPHDLDDRVETRVVEGDPVTEILAAAEGSECDLIVLGTHGRRGLRRALLGSVAEGVLRSARCPVLTIKAPVAETVPDVAIPQPVVAVDTLQRK
jgi:nucleotide-binding universal stress UspA family protein